MKTLRNALFAAATVAAVSTAAIAQTEIRIDRVDDASNLDPGHQNVAKTEWAINNALFSSLLKFKSGTWEVENDLAESWSLAEDGLTAEFKIREGVQFHKGYGEVTADDVAFSFMRIIDPAEDSTQASKWGTLDRVEVLDRYAVRIHFKETYAPLFNSTLPWAGGKIVSRKAVEEMGSEAFGRNPIGSGPYQFSEWVPNDHITLTVFEDYFGENATVDAITFIPIADGATVEAALKAGELDIGRINLINIASIEANPDLDVIVVPGTRYVWIPLNHSRAPMDNILLRKAFRAALDVDEIVFAMYDGHAERSDSNVLPSVLGHWAASLYDQDIDAAKAFMAEAGFPDGFELEILTGPQDEYVIAAEVIQAQLAKAGIIATVAVMEDGAATDRSLAGEFDVRMSDWTATSDPHNSTTWFKGGQKWNYVHWDNAAYNDAVNAGTIETDPTKRAEYYEIAQQVWDAEVAGIPLTHGVSAMAVRRGVDIGQLFPGGELAIWSMTK